MSVQKVFITGATGYIGGEILYQLLNSKTHKFEVTALARSQAKADALEKATNNKVSTVIGDLDDLELIEKAINANNIIINTANVDHVPSAAIFAETLVEKTTPTILIHTSGTSVLGDQLQQGKKPTTKVFSDKNDISEINTLPLEQPHRPVDEIILGINERNPIVETAIVCPSTIFGQSDGFDNIISVQIPYLIKLSYAKDQAFSVYDGSYIWSHIHIKDLGDLYIHILDKLISGLDIPKGKNGYYFGSYALSNEQEVNDRPTEIEHYWKDVSKAVSENLFKRRLISKSEVAELTPKEIISLANNDNFAPLYWGTNSRSRADNGIKIGWKPKYSGIQDFWDSISEDVDYLIKKGALKK